MVRIYTVAQSSAAFIKQYETREGAKPIEEMSEARIFPMHLEVRDKSWNKDEIERTMADDLVSDADVATFCVTRFRECHGVAPQDWTE
jgi:hypothetical protein